MYIYSHLKKVISSTNIPSTIMPFTIILSIIANHIAFLQFPQYPAFGLNCKIPYANILFCSLFYCIAVFNRTSLYLCVYSIMFSISYRLFLYSISHFVSSSECAILAKVQFRFAVFSSSLILAILFSVYFCYRSANFMILIIALSSSILSIPLQTWYFLHCGHFTTSIYSMYPSPILTVASLTIFSVHSLHTTCSHQSFLGLFSIKLQLALHTTHSIS